MGGKKAAKAQQESGAQASSHAPAGQAQDEGNQNNDIAEISFTEIEKLQSLGINMADINKLKQEGYQTVLSVLMATKKELTRIKGLSEAKVDKIQECANKLEGGGFTTGMAVQARRARLARLTTGSPAFDQLLGGGVESLSITEVFGEFRSGKTQLCHTLCVTAQMPRSQGGGNGKVAYIDTEGTFRPERIVPIAERFGLDPEAVLDNIIYARAFTSEHQSTLITLIAAKMVEEPFALLVIDSIMALFRVDFIGRGELADRQNHLGRQLSKLIKIAEQFNVAVVITNQVMADPGANMSFVADPKKPIGGHILAHASTTRLYLRKGKGEQRICKIFDSPSLPEADATFALSPGGIRDP